jgi:hypothetical protein
MKPLSQVIPQGEAVARERHPIQQALLGLLESPDNLLPGLAVEGPPLAVREAHTRFPTAIGPMGH